MVLANPTHHQISEFYARPEKWSLLWPDESKVPLSLQANVWLLLPTSSTYVFEQRPQRSLCGGRACDVFSMVVHLCLSSFLVMSAVKGFASSCCCVLVLLSLLAVVTSTGKYAYIHFHAHHNASGCSHTLTDKYAYIHFHADYSTRGCPQALTKKRAHIHMHADLQ